MASARHSTRQPTQDVDDADNTRMLPNVQDVLSARGETAQCGACCRLCCCPRDIIDGDKVDVKWRCLVGLIHVAHAVLVIRDGEGACAARTRRTVVGVDVSRRDCNAINKRLCVARDGDKVPLRVLE